MILLKWFKNRDERDKYIANKYYQKGAQDMQVKKDKKIDFIKKEHQKNIDNKNKDINSKNKQVLKIEAKLKKFHYIFAQIKNMSMTIENEEEIERIRFLEQSQKQLNRAHRAEYIALQYDKMLPDIASEIERYKNKNI